MHFPARKTIDTYLSRNHVVVHTFSSVRESITFIKSKWKSSFCKVEISINSLVESRGAAHQDLWYSNIREAMKGGDDHERHETSDDEAAADDPDGQARQTPDGGSSYSQLQRPCHYPARQDSGWPQRAKRLRRRGTASDGAAGKPPVHPAGAFI